jgi:hypothetical protein
VPLPDLSTVLLVAVAALLLAGALSPLETLGWWAGWYGDPVDDDADDPSERETATTPGPIDAGHGLADARAELDAGPPRPDGGPAGRERARAGPAVGDAPRIAGDAAGDDAAAGDEGSDAATVEPWVVFLSGIHAVEAASHVDHEAELLARLRRALPRGRVIQVFPYSVTDRALTGERAFAGLWRWALRAKASRRRITQLLGFIINLRNVWQVLVSADRRYGPFYNRGSAAVIVRALRRRGLAAGVRSRIVLIGYSGGAQVALGAAPFVKEATDASVTVVSLGGVLAADPGLLTADATWHVYGRRDRVQRWSAWAFPGRWRLLPWSPWNVARRHGTLRTLLLGPSDHTGQDGYLDAEARVADGRSHLDVTADVLAALAAGRSHDLPVAA